MPIHLTVRNQLSVCVAFDFARPPTIIDVNYCDHVPLNKEKSMQLINYLPCMLEIRSYLLKPEPRAMELHCIKYYFQHTKNRLKYNLHI